MLLDNFSWLFSGLFISYFHRINANRSQVSQNLLFRALLPAPFPPVCNFGLYFMEKRDHRVLRSNPSHTLTYICTCLLAFYLSLQGNHVLPPVQNHSSTLILMLSPSTPSLKNYPLCLIYFQLLFPLDTFLLVSKHAQVL